MHTHTHRGAVKLTQRHRYIETDTVVSHAHTHTHTHTSVWRPVRPCPRLAPLELAMGLAFTWGCPPEERLEGLTWQAE